MASLDELARTKSGDGQTNLIDFIVSYLHLLHQRKGDPADVLEGPYLAELTPVLSQVTLIDVSGLQEERAVIVQGLDDLNAELAGLREERAAAPASQMDGDEFVDQMGDFVEEAARRLMVDERDQGGGCHCREKCGQAQVAMKRRGEHQCDAGSGDAIGRAPGRGREWRRL